MVSLVATGLIGIGALSLGVLAGHLWTLRRFYRIARKLMKESPPRADLVGNLHDRLEETCSGDK